MRILLAEDEADLNRILTRKLSEEGYSVDSCLDGAEAMEYLEAAEYDGAVLDVMMPRLDGFTLVARMREKGIATPVLFLTARDSVEDRVRGLDSGASDYLIKPFSMEELLARVRALIRQDGFNIDGFLCPGHVATILGERGFQYLPAEFGLPGVIAGFEPEDILLAVYLLLRQIAEGRPRIENAYPRAVSHDGNVLAQKMLSRCFEARADVWRGLGVIPASGLGLKEELSDFDAEKRFQIRYSETEPPTACRCGEVITGRLRPEGCPLFGTACTPEDPVGPCMVSSEGACAAAYKYQGVL